RRLMVNVPKPSGKTAESSVMLAASEIEVMLDGWKVATSAAPSGTVCGSQLVGSFQLEFCGFGCQVADPAWLTCRPSRKTEARKAALATYLAEPLENIRRKQ